MDDELRKLLLAQIVVVTLGTATAGQVLALFGFPTLLGLFMVLAAGVTAGLAFTALIGRLAGES